MSAELSIGRQQNRQNQQNSVLCLEKRKLFATQLLWLCGVKSFMTFAFLRRPAPVEQRQQKSTESTEFCLHIFSSIRFRPSSSGSDFTKAEGDQGGKNRPR